MTNQQDGHSMVHCITHCVRYTWVHAWTHTRAHTHTPWVGVKASSRIRTDQKTVCYSNSLPLHGSAITEWKKNAWQCFAVTEAISNKQYKPSNLVADPSTC